MHPLSHSHIFQAGLVSLVSVLLLLLLADAPTCSAPDCRIVGGRPAIEGEFPYQVSIRRSFNDLHFCGGSLITDRHVLTAAHCMFYQWGGILPPIVISVVAGQLNLTITTDTIFRNASKFTIHPNFNKTAMSNDVAIIEVDRAFPLNQFISTIPLAKGEVSCLECIVSGWGVEVFGSQVSSETLLTTAVTRISSERCNEMYGNGTIEESMLCAYDEEGKHDACQGDSGGPLVCEGKLLGVISTGEGCANKNYPGIYANVPYLYEWIQQNVDDLKPSTEIPSTTTQTTISTRENENITSTTNSTISGPPEVKTSSLTSQKRDTFETTTDINTPNKKTTPFPTEYTPSNKKTITKEPNNGVGRSQHSLGLLLGTLSMTIVCMYILT